LCPPGSGFSEYGCTICREGEYSNSRSGYCVQCPPGTYGNLPESAQCTVCPTNTATADYGSTICPPCGHPAYNTVYCNGPSAAPTSLSPTSAPTCPPGYGISEKGTCIECLRGQYASPKSGYCVDCPPGTYNNNPGASECTRCSPSSVCPVYGCTVCIQCEHNAYSPTACDPPPTAIPTVKPSAAPISPPPTANPTCPPGYGIFEKGTCRLCSQGEYLDRSGYCADCRPGTFSNLSGQYMCTPCSRTSVCPTYHCINCIECGYNAYSPTVCDPPPTSTPTSKPSAAITSPPPTSRPTCPPGYGIWDRGTCRLCTQGEYLDRSGYCVSCRPGTFTSLSGQYMCTRCSRTSVCPAYGCSSCIECGYIAYSPTACNPPPTPTPSSRPSSSKPTAKPSISKKPTSKPTSKPSRRPSKRPRSSRFPIMMYDGKPLPPDYIPTDDTVAVQ
jgi:Tyrosine-protein kinase ephrin type A/B receptor-like